jgi:lipoprotein-anchoring transpeptidase ErfK/SrfK
MSSPTDYYSVLSRVTAALDPAAEEDRHSIYDRARRAIVDADLPARQMQAERSALEAAIERIETEMHQGRARVPPPPRPRRAAPAQATEAPHRGAQQQQPRTLGLTPGMLAALATVAVLLLAVVGYALWPGGTASDRSDPGRRAEVPAARSKAETATERTNEPGRSYVFNRQLVYYRTVHPVGTIVIAKSQRFLYLVRPNVAALRYTVGVGRECANAVGLLLVSAKEEWPETPAKSRFGIRSLALGDTGHRIHGTYARSTAGDEGCFPLVNDDIADLYDRVPVGTRVVMN